MTKEARRLRVLTLAERGVTLAEAQARFALVPGDLKDVCRFKKSRSVYSPSKLYPQPAVVSAARAKHRTGARLRAAPAARAAAAAARAADAAARAARRAPRGRRGGPPRAPRDSHCRARRAGHARGRGTPARRRVAALQPRFNRGAEAAAVTEATVVAFLRREFEYANNLSQFKGSVDRKLRTQRASIHAARATPASSSPQSMSPPT